MNRSHQSQLVLDFDADFDVVRKSNTDTLKRISIDIQVGSNGLTSRSESDQPPQNSDIRISVDKGAITPLLKAHPKPEPTSIESFELHGETWDLKQCEIFAHDLLTYSLRDLMKQASSIDFQSAATWLFGKPYGSFTPSYIAKCLGLDIEELLDGAFQLLDDDSKDFIKTLKE